MNKLGIIDRKKTVFILVDIQEKLLKTVKDRKKIISNSNILIRTAEILNIPLIVTEQYPKGLGSISKKIILPKNKYLIEKISFSCFDSKKFFRKIKELKPNSIVLFGIEAHICILKTSLDALKNRFEVHVVIDATSSRTPLNKSLAIKRMYQSGVFTVSTEMIIFQLLKKASTKEFKLISQLIK